jgi:hypothetical protein
LRLAYSLMLGVMEWYVLMLECSVLCSSCR